MLTFGSIIGKAVCFIRTVVLTMSSFTGCLLLRKLCSNTPIRIPFTIVLSKARKTPIIATGLSLSSRAAGGNKAIAWHLHGGQTSTRSCSGRISTDPPFSFISRSKGSIIMSSIFRFVRFLRSLMNAVASVPNSLGAPD